MSGPVVFSCMSCWLAHTPLKIPQTGEAYLCVFSASAYSRGSWHAVLVPHCLSACLR